MIFRIWHGWTTPENADAYERIVQGEVFAMIAAKKVGGYRGIDLLGEVSATRSSSSTIMRFDSLEAREGLRRRDDYELSFVPPQARAVLKRFDERAQHYDHVRHIDYAEKGEGSRWLKSLEARHEHRRRAPAR